MRANTKKVIVAGHICLDITPTFMSYNGEEIMSLLKPGKLLNVGEADVHTGGAVANTGLAMKLLGVDVKLIGKIGKDSFGEFIINILDKHQASDYMIKSDDSNTSYSIVIAPPNIDRIFLHSSGVNNTFSLKDLDFDMMRDTSLFHFGYPTLMKKMYEEDGKQLISMYQKLKSLGIVTSMDMAAVDEFSEAGSVDWKKILKKVLLYVDIFLPSIEELAYMLDRKAYKEWNKRANGKDITSVLNIKKDIKPLADKLIELGVKVAIVKCGAPGIYYKVCQKEKLKEIEKKFSNDATDWANKEGFIESYLPEKVLSTTGAGDTSIAAFLTSFIKGDSLETCLDMTVAMGAVCVESYDALSGLKTFAELSEKIKNGWKKQFLLTDY